MYLSMYPFCVLFLALLLARATPSSNAETNDCLRRSVSVSVLDRDGRPVTDLSAQQLHAELNGKTIEIISLPVERQSRRIAILLDASGSMRGQEGMRWKLAVGVAEQLANSNLGASFSLWILGTYPDEKVD